MYNREMVEEKELLTILSKEEYQKVLKKLIKELGEPEIVKRLALQCTNYGWDDVDTRIRITNRVAEIIQKVGSWKGEVRKEITIPLPSDPTTILDMYSIFRNSNRDENVMVPVMQMENRLFKDKNIEIKLTYQFGKKDAYNCEIEVFDSELDPKEIAEKLNIPIHLPAHTPDFWKKWNKEINFSATELSDEELLVIIKNYTK